jgi:NADH-quinone oxidoreductase subunit I
MIYHKEQLLEPVGQSTVGSAAVWFDEAPPDAEQPVPQRSLLFDGSRASAAAVGLGDTANEEPVLIANADQDEDRRKFEKKDGLEV